MTMNVVPENGPKNRPLICEYCNYIEFSSVSEFNRHHLTHVRQPRVSLTRLSDSCVKKISKDSYRVKSGVARRSKNQVPPLTLSVVNQNGDKQFLVVKKQNLPSSSDSEESPERELNSLTVTPKMDKEEEMLKRLGSRVSVTRRRKTSTRTHNRSQQQITTSTTTTTNTVSAENTSTNSTQVPKIVIRVPYVKLERIDKDEIESHTSKTTPTKKAKIESSHNSSSHSNNSNTPVSHPVTEPTKVKIANGNDSPATESRRCSQTKYSNCCKRKQQSPQETNRNDSVSDLRDRADTPRRAPERRSSAEYEMSDQITNREDSNMNTTEPPPMPSTSSGFPMNMDLSACVQTISQENASSNCGVESENVSSTLITPNQKNENHNIQHMTMSATDNFAESIFVAEAEEVRENLCETMTGDRQDLRRGPQQPNEQAAFWATLQRVVTGSQNGKHQDILLAHPLPTDDTVTANFLHSILTEHMQHGITTENAEFVSLERLAAQQTMSTTNEITPMEQLTQQVQRLSNPPPQFNVLPQQIQAPPPLHAAGVPLSQQPVYEGVSQVQPTMGPPPLFQGFTVYPNQGYQQQGSPQQIIPRPPALQQCPQLQSGTLQNAPCKMTGLAQPQPTRPKARASSKRTIPGPPPPPELLAPKQNRLDSSIKGKSQPSKGKGKAKAPATPPTSGARAPARKTMDPQMVANILAARGITVTPSTSRQANVVQRPQQKNTRSSPVLNISSAISIAPSNQNKNNVVKKAKNVAAPVPRRNSAPVINNDVERPERCRTVDLTDDREPQVDLNAPGPSVNRFLCSQCGQKFPTAASLELHKASHRAAETPTFRCEPCNIEFSVAEDLERHRNDNHKYRRNGPNWVIPVIDLDFPGAEERLLEYGITNFIPLSFEEDEGNLALPIVRQDTPRQHRQFIGMSNAIVLGQIRSLLGPRHY